MKKSITTAVVCALCATVVAGIDVPREARANTTQQRLLRPDDVLREQLISSAPGDKVFLLSHLR